MSATPRKPAGSLTTAVTTTDLLTRLTSALRPEGGCPYYPGGPAFTEPTLLAALALLAPGTTSPAAENLVAWVRRIQNQNGCVGVNARHREQGTWLTALAAIVFRHHGDAESLDRAVAFLLALRSATEANDPRLKQDNTLVGWPWIPGTFGWVEPTAWALIALSLAGQRSHPRVVEGARFLIDRQIPSGGWNYGNPALNDKELLPFWDTTGLALTALRPLVPAERIRSSLDLVETKQDLIVSLSGLAWAVFGLDAFGRETGRIRARLLKTMSSMPDEELHLGNFSLGLLALSNKKVFSP